MNLFQQILKALYPVRMRFQEATGWGKKIKGNNKMIPPATSFYTLQATQNNGVNYSFESLKNKYVLIVNTASNCGFTGQYEELEKLYQSHKINLEILAFPANNFGGQEPGSNEKIASFCKLNYGVSFSIFAKASVKGNDQQPVFNWLTRASQNGWNNQSPNWNFCKYLISPSGELLGFFSSAVSPLGKEIVEQIK